MSWNGGPGGYRGGYNGGGNGGFRGDGGRGGYYGGGRGEYHGGGNGPFQGGNGQFYVGNGYGFQGGVNGPFQGGGNELFLGSGIGPFQGGGGGNGPFQGGGGGNGPFQGGGGGNGSFQGGGQGLFQSGGRGGFHGSERGGFQGGQRGNQGGLRGGYQGQSAAGVVGGHRGGVGHGSGHGTSVVSPTPPSNSAAIDSSAGVIKDEIKEEVLDTKEKSSVPDPSQGTSDKPNVAPYSAPSTSAAVLGNQEVKEESVEWQSKGGDAGEGEDDDAGDDDDDDDVEDDDDDVAPGMQPVNFDPECNDMEQMLCRIKEAKKVFSIMWKLDYHGCIVCLRDHEPDATNNLNTCATQCPICKTQFTAGNKRHFAIHCHKLVRDKKGAVKRNAVLNGLRKFGSNDLVEKLSCTQPNPSDKRRQFKKKKRSKIPAEERPGKAGCQARSKIRKAIMRAIEEGDPGARARLAEFEMQCAQGQSAPGRGGATRGGPGFGRGGPGFGFPGF